MRDDFNVDQVLGVVFVRLPKEEAYGTVAVFRDLYGDLWDHTERECASTHSKNLIPMYA